METNTAETQAVFIKVNLQPIADGTVDRSAKLNFARDGDVWVCKLPDEMMRDMKELYPHVAIPKTVETR